MAVGASCSACSTELRVGAKFCDKCGTAVGAVRTAAEYKQVTVLFADVVHSMDLAARVGPERLREIMAALVDRCGAVVRRYGGTLDKFTGDGIMAVFGAPLALEDHAVRACLAALAIQGVDVGVQLRVGLNSGQVIVGEIGYGAGGYTAVGEAVGLAQRMESVAPPGAVMLSESTARLVEHAASLAEPELMRIKGAAAPVAVRRLLGMSTAHGSTVRPDTDLVGRTWEMGALEALLDRCTGTKGCVVGIAGPAGIGKSRLARETAAAARRRGIEVFTTSCESHTSGVSFDVVARLLRGAAGVEGLDDQSARAHLRDRLPDADAEDLMLFDDMLGIRDPAVPLPAVDPDARRRRLTGLINAASLARTTPALYVVEDVHWIDDVSESMIADLVTVIPHTPTLVLITYRPEYRGKLAQLPSAQTIALAPLDDSETTRLIEILLGHHPSVAEIAASVLARADGNPFFAAEMVRELAERGVLDGDRGDYVCRTDGALVSLPATLQATIAARIDRLAPGAKVTLNAAAVVGSRFDPELLVALGVEPVLDDLLAAELVDQVAFSPRPEYAFHHPLVRTVAYESQLKSHRADLHRRLAAALEARSADDNPALVAAHLEAAGDLQSAFEWHMRAGAWSTNRDIVAAHRSWQRARQIADALPADHPGRLPMRIAPRTLLCASSFRAHINPTEDGSFGELSELCDTAGDKVSLAIGMTGPVAQAMGRGDVPEAARLAFAHLALVESIGDPTLTVGLSVAMTAVLLEVGEMAEVLRLSQTVIDLADGDPTMGNFILGSPLAVAIAARGTARWALGLPDWRDDLERATAMARRTDRMAHALVVAYAKTLAITNGVLVADDSALRDIEEAAQVVEAWGDNVALAIAGPARGRSAGRWAHLPRHRRTAPACPAGPRPGRRGRIPQAGNPIP